MEEPKDRTTQPPEESFILLPRPCPACHHPDGLSPKAPGPAQVCRECGSEVRKKRTLEDLHEELSSNRLPDWYT